jgi:hypothetical protein
MKSQYKIIQKFKPTKIEGDDFLNELSKQNKMSKRKSKIVNVEVPQGPSEDTIKKVMALYAPNKIQKFFMKYFSHLTQLTDLKTQTRIVYSLVGVFCVEVLTKILDWKTGFVLSTILLGLGLLPIAVGSVYNLITNKKRMTQIGAVLNVSKKEVEDLEVKYYIS